MAEWSKALDLSSSIGFDAEVRTLQEALTLLPSRLGAHPGWCDRTRSHDLSHRSSAGRAEDCKVEGFGPMRISLGRWFESGR